MHQVHKNIRYTYEDYLTWPDDERWELIKGVPYDMTPSPTRHHQEIVVELSRQAANHFCDRPCRVYVAPFDVRLKLRHEEKTETVVQPDLAVVCDEEKLDEKGCFGAPDWIVEVLSPSTAAKDKIVKLALYEEHGVREYWLVHPQDRTVTIYTLSDGVYSRPEIEETRGATGVRIFPELEIDWSYAFVEKETPPVLKKPAPATE